MTLTARLNLFFLSTLAAVLAGFSVVLYQLADDHLRRQLDHRLIHAADTLAGAVEFEPVGGDGGLEWERAGRFLPVGDEYVWAATAGDGPPLDATPQPWAADLLAAGGRAESAGHSHVPYRFDHDGRAWRVIRTEYADPPPVLRPLAPGRHPAIVVTAAVSLEPLHATLRRLALTLVGLSAAVWLVALVGGRWVCRRALRPLNRMAAAARAMPADDAGRRLPVAASADELADLGLAFNGLLDRLAAAHDRQRRFTGEASHQLRTPLAALLGQAEVALRRDRSPDEYRRTLASVHGQADRLRLLVEALLTLARADDPARPPDREVVDLAVWLPEYLRGWADHPRSADLRAEFAGGTVRVLAHPILLGEVVTNLLDNAVKYSPAGTPVTVRVGADAGGGWVEVEDEGGGVAPADRPDLFRPFHRSADARRLGVPGVGLGLAVAARLAAAFGGSVGYAPAPAGGSRFRVTCPGV